MCCWSGYACTEVVNSCYPKRGIAYRELDAWNCCFLNFDTRWRHVVCCTPRPSYPLLQPTPALQNPSDRRQVGSQTRCEYSDHESYWTLPLVGVRLGTLISYSLLLMKSCGIVRYFHILLRVSTHLTISMIWNGVL